MLARLGDHEGIGRAALSVEPRHDLIEMGDIAEDVRAAHLAAGQIAVELDDPDDFVRALDSSPNRRITRSASAADPKISSLVPLRVRLPPGHPDADRRPAAPRAARSS